MKYEIYVDLDGVLVDFLSGVKKVFKNKEYEYLPKKVFWNTLKNEKDFFTNLKWLKDGKLLWNYIKKYNPIILSGIPVGDWAIPQKKEWCRKNLGDNVNVILLYAKDKKKYSSKNSILIDDNEKNIVDWIEQGGIGIHHINYDATIKKLKELGL
ncbi:MAG: hypothetical protein NZZ41_00355 [Candidatus Dojkabacteria bacterium]|nr:hypothetical protein [Candidatus Dojkabacteria bacterium]